VCCACVACRRRRARFLTRRARVESAASRRKCTNQRTRAHLKQPRVNDMHICVYGYHRTVHPPSARLTVCARDSPCWWFQAIAYGKAHGGSNVADQLELTIDRLFINVGTEITKIIPGLVSTEVDSKSGRPRAHRQRHATTRDRDDTTRRTLMTHRMCIYCRRRRRRRV
jgi:hypothetical protein